MFKLFVLAACLAVAAARPSHLSHLETSPLVYSAPTSYIQEHSYANVGAVVKNIPTAVSHQSQSIVHSSAQVVEPIIAPVVKTYTATAPVYSAPLVQTYASAPVYESYSAPLVHSYSAAPVLKSYASPLTYAAAPLSYASTYSEPAHYSAPAHYSVPAHYSAPAHYSVPAQYSAW